MSNVVKFELPKVDASHELSSTGNLAAAAPEAKSPVEGEASSTQESPKLFVLAAEEGEKLTAGAEVPALVPAKVEEPAGAQQKEPSTVEVASANSPGAQAAATAEPESPFGDVLKFLFLTVASSVALVWFMFKSLCLYAVKHPLHVLLNISMLVLLALVVVTGSEIHSQMILGKISDQTIDRVIKGSRFTREYDAEEVNRGSSREFLKVGAPVWAQREAVRAILFHSRKAGLSIEDQAVLLATADIESGFNPMARASTTTACGLFQFVKRTGEIFGLSQSECMDPWKNAQAGVAHFMYNYERRVASAVQDSVGAERLFRVFELSYYLHHDGPESSNPGNEVKATILGGSQFLFRAYKALKEESESQQRAPTFTEKFEENFWKTLDVIKVFFSDFSFSDLLRMGSDRLHAAISPAFSDDSPVVPSAEAETVQENE